MGQLGGCRQTARRRIASVPLFAVECCGLPSPDRAGGRTIRVPGSQQLRPYQESAMGEPSSGTPSSVNPPEDRLDSWKEIAAYLNRDVTTVQRWEKREGMPVHRHLHDRMGSVYSLSPELDAWRQSRKLGLEEDQKEPATAAQMDVETARPPTAPRVRRWLVLSSAVAVLALLVLPYVIARIRAGDSSKPKIKSLAVLPLQNLSGDPAQDYFADGMTE